MKRDIAIATVRSFIKWLESNTEGAAIMRLDRYEHPDGPAEWELDDWLKQWALTHEGGASEA